LVDFLEEIKMARRGKVLIDREMCKGCYLCVRACPAKVLEADKKPNSTGTYPSIAANSDKCIACGNCYQVCPDVCIEVYELEGDEK
jgi:2-oxoglutarate ferredoxin oxidoreductase subunit delta